MKRGTGVGDGDDRLAADVALSFGSCSGWFESERGWRL